MNRAPVSVVIPCYKCGDTIDRAVNSVLRQTLKPSEIILVDDKSPDATLECLYKLKDLHSTELIKIVCQEKNMGPGSARNLGWQIAAQPYIAFLDSDDSWHERKLEIQYNWMRQRPDVAMTAHGCFYVGSRKKESALEYIEEPKKISKFFLLFFNRLPTMSVMLRKDIDRRFPESKRYAEDYSLWLSIAFSGAEIYKFSSCLGSKFKPEYGASGLSGNLYAMQKGEIDTYTRLRLAGVIRPLLFFFCVTFSYLKFIRRIIIVNVRYVLWG